MARPYLDWTDDQLKTEIAEYRAAIKTASLGGEVAVIVSEGRRMEIQAGNVRAARAELRELEAELCRRPGYEHLRSTGIGVRFS